MPLMKIEVVVIDRIKLVESIKPYESVFEDIRERKVRLEELRSDIEDGFQGIGKLREDGSIAEDDFRQRSLDIEQNKKECEREMVMEDTVVHGLIGPRNFFKSVIEQLATLCGVQTVSSQSGKWLGPDTMSRSQIQVEQDILENIKNENNRVCETLIAELSNNSSYSTGVLTSFHPVKNGFMRVMHECALGNTGAEDLTIRIGRELEVFGREMQEMVSLNPKYTGEMGKACTEAILKLGETGWSNITNIIEQYVQQIQQLHDDLEASKGGGTVLFQTCQGCTGFGSQDLRTGDELALIHGFPQIAVLRSAGDQADQLDRFTFRGRVLLCTPNNDREIQGTELQDVWIGQEVVKMIEIV